ncbi:MalY/PatB family protein [Dysosmobacter sp. HCP28S3_G4]|uniref:MalY/PatB family protein n=1 Tax=Dysosmobacter sp. HCP28S3_G4 TaxID=3438938 RepID=UPI003F8CABB4
MTAYDFDQIIDRRNTNSLKYDFAVERGLPADVLPLWVADMDFRAPEPVLDALRKTVDHGIFGYSDVKDGYYDAVSQWFLTRFGWQTRPEWLVKTPGVVFALAMAVRALTQPGDSVLIQPPVYYPFFNVIRSNDRKVVESRLVYKDGAYAIDFADFERKAAKEHVKLFILCSPHNPIGRVWTVEELRRLGDICRKHGIYVVSDEIHCDFTLPGHPHHVFLDAVPELTERAIVCTAPSKTFNLAGLQASNIWIPGEEIRKRFVREMSRCGYSGLNRMGLIACQAAYEGGGDWLDGCRTYLRDNLDFLRAFLAERIPQVRLVEPEGTYFAWLDCSGLGLSQEALDELIIRRAKLWLDAGHIFGGNGGQFQRVVLACPRATLRQALEQLAQAVSGV